MDTRSLADELHSIVGDVPVAEQFGDALEYMAPKKHEHSEYVTNVEFEDLKKKVESLARLVGDMSVSEQICEAINNIT